MPESWVNGHVELLCALDSVSPESSVHECQEAVGEFMDWLSERLPEPQQQRIVMRGWHEVVDAEDLGPEPTIPEPPAFGEEAVVTQHAKVEPVWPIKAIVVTDEMVERAAAAVGRTRKARVSAAVPVQGRAADIAYARAALTAALRQERPS